VYDYCLMFVETEISRLEISFSEIEMEADPFNCGAYGEVHHAKWHEEEVVLKVIKLIRDKDREAAKNEYTLTHRLHHFNVIELFGITHVTQRQLGIVMEKATHGSLDRWIGKLRVASMKKIASGIVDGLKYVHSEHVIHRDIKPQNILMFGPEDDMIPKIADFGVSKIIDTVRKTHTRERGTFLYWAPEVQYGMKYGFSADIYSLATVLFEIFDKQLICNASDEVMNAFLRSDRKLPMNSKVPTYLRDVIQRGWHVTPEERPSLSEYHSVLQGLIFLSLQNNHCKHVVN